MAEELSYITLVGTGTAGQVNNAISSWKNETGDDITLRDIDLEGEGVTSGTETVKLQLTKQNTFLSSDLDSNWRVEARGKIQAQAAPGGSVSVEKNKKYGKGQVIVEKNETLYLHNQLGTNFTADSWQAVVGYHAL